MKKIENIEENIDLDVSSVTLSIPVRVTMMSSNDTPFEFTTSIDELGQIILTPTTKEVEFVDASIESDVDYDTPILRQETVTITEDEYTTKEFSINIQAAMLAESSNTEVSVMVDEIGQLVISPIDKQNVFVSASFEESLNLVTEALEVTEYCGYQLRNSGDGWDVINPDGDIVDEGVASLPEAKILVCQTEIDKFKGLTENISTESTDQPKESSETPESVTADVIEEAVTTTSNEFSYTDIDAKLKEITNNFQDENGVVRCDTAREQQDCAKILTQHYETVFEDSDDDQLLVSYSVLKNDLTESATNIDLIGRFMRGEVALFSDSGTPLSSYIHIPELDDNGYEYYYDEESDAIVSYPSIK